MNGKKSLRGTGFGTKTAGWSHLNQCGIERNPDNGGPAQGPSPKTNQNLAILWLTMAARCSPMVQDKKKRVAKKGGDFFGRQRKGLAWGGGGGGGGWRKRVKKH